MKEKAFLGDFQIPSVKFADLSRKLKEFHSEKFKKGNAQQKSERISHVLFDLIQQEKTPCFLLPAVLDYIDRINALKSCEPYAFLHFELWLNQFPDLTDEENLLVRGKIAGKWIPRDAYQALFPIGMNKSYGGSHFVTAHGSPDLDTTIASFWGWVDAFAARVAQGLHLWNVPGGPPLSQIEIPLLFDQLFGGDIFRDLAKNRSALALSGIDLMTQQMMKKKLPHESMLGMHQREQPAIIIVDEEGYYLGDWRSVDVEEVRGVISLFDSCLRWFAMHVYVKWIALFSKEHVSTKEFPVFVDGIFSLQIKECEPMREFSERQKQHLDIYLKKVLHVKKGVESSFADLAIALKGLSLFALDEWMDYLRSLPIFERSGSLVENRPRLFSTLEKAILGLEKAIQNIRAYVEQLEIGLKIKIHVFNYRPHSINYRAEVEEIRSQMDNYTYLTVTETEASGELIPLGIIHASDIYKNTLGTVTMRDFCNREETKIPSYFEIISVIDHHKSHLQTSAATMVFVSDAQSSNVLCAELAFRINDQFSKGGMTEPQIEKQLMQEQKQLSSSSSKRLVRRLLQRLLATEGKKQHFIDPLREYVEYLHFLYAIFDDTDLLTKVSIRDLECVAKILNRLKSLTLKKEVEIIDLSDLARDESFAAKAALRILQHPDTYSLYSKVYRAREQSIDDHIKLCAKKQPCSLFSDTKEQNRCVRVGQTKLFGGNYPAFAKHEASLKQHWYDASREFYHEHPEVDLYLQMISTIASAEDLYEGTKGTYAHQDALWIWIPFTEQSIEHFKNFLNAFRSCSQLKQGDLHAEFYGSKAKEYEHIFTESFLSIPKKLFPEKKQLPLAILKFKAGLLNSRKTLITPYLPKLVE